MTTTQLEENYWFQAEVHVKTKKGDGIAILPVDYDNPVGPSGCELAQLFEKFKASYWAQKSSSEIFAIRIFKANRPMLSGPRYRVAQQIRTMDYSDFLDFSGRPIRDNTVLERAKRNLAQYPQ